MMQESDDLNLLAEVASLYYEENYTQEQIARVIGVSRSGVSRLLTRSRESGLVDIHVHQALRTSVPLRNELTQLFGLQHAQVLLDTASDELALSDVGVLAARYIDRRIQEAQQVSGDRGEKAIRTVGISWGRATREMVKALRPRRRLPLDIVQLEGSIDRFSGMDIDAPEVVRSLVETYGASGCYFLHSPFLVKDAHMKEGLLKEPGVQRTFQGMENMDLAIVGISKATAERSSLINAGYLEEAELAELRDQQAVGEICGHFFTLEGQICASSVLDRMIAVPLEVLRDVPEVVAIAVGEGQAAAIVGALRTGVVNVLITDERSARALIRVAAGETR